MAWGDLALIPTVAQADTKRTKLGYDALALEYDDYGNVARWPAFRDACTAWNMASGVWVTEGAMIANVPADADFAIAELEGPGDYDGILAAPTPAMPHAVITNFNTITAERAAPLIERGYACMTEAYIGDNPLATPPGLDNDARWRGWDYSVPCFGIYNAALEDFAAWFDWPYGWAIYLAEYL